MYAATASSPSRYLAASKGFDLFFLDAIGLPLIFGRQPLRLGDIAFLRLLVTTSEKQDIPCAALSIIDSVSWSVVDPQLADTFADWRDVARVAPGKAVDTDEDFGFGARVSQRAQPFRELLRLADVEHARL